MLQRVLIISPDMGLDVQDEIINAASGFAPKILANTVTRQRALEEIASGQYDVIHFITHGKEHVLEVSDGIVEEDMLEHAVCTANNVKVLFLNACRSAHAATTVYNNTNVAYSIGWPDDVENKVALTWARLFFEALRMAPNDVKRAVEVANEAVVKSYRIDPDQLPLVLNGRVSQILEENQRLRQELERRGVVRLPLWMVAANLALIALLLVNLLILALTH